MHKGPEDEAQRPADNGGGGPPPCGQGVRQRGRTARPPLPSPFAGSAALPPGRRLCRPPPPPARRRPGASPQNHWTPQLEAVARRAMTQASGYSWMYEQMVARAKMWGGALAICTGILAGVVGTQGLLSAFASCETVPSWAGGVTAATGYAIALLTVLDGTWKLDVVCSEGLVAQVDFAHLSRSIQFQLALRPSERQDAHDFVKGVLNEIETLKLSSPSIDSLVRKDYVSKFRDNPIYNPAGGWEDRGEPAAGSGEGSGAEAESPPPCSEEAGSSTPRNGEGASWDPRSPRRSSAQSGEEGSPGPPKRQASPGAAVPREALLAMFDAYEQSCEAYGQAGDVAERAGGKRGA